jgi:hypothetical protein
LERGINADDGRGEVINGMMLRRLTQCFATILDWFDFAPSCAEVDAR